MVESCKHHYIKGKGFFVCNQCGLEAEDSPIIRLEKPFEEFNYVKTTNKQYRHLMKMNKFYAEAPKHVFDWNQYVLYNALYNEFEINEETRNKAIYYFTKIARNETVSNKIKLMVTCLYVSCKENNNTKFLLRHVIEHIRKVGYSIHSNDIIQCFLNYSKYFKHIKKVSEDYISNIISKVIDYDGIVERMKITNPNINNSEAKRIFELNAYKILEKYPKRLRGCCNPISFAMATVYTTTLLLEYKYGFVDLLTPETMNEATGISAHATREIFLKYFRKILIKDKIVSENRFKKDRYR